MTTSLYARIRADIERDILSGKRRPGDRLPPEHELMARYCCARMTVNKALASLTDAGLIVRRRRAGTFVAAPRIQSVILEIPDIQSDIVARGAVYAIQLLSRRRRKPNARRAEEKILAGKGDLLVVQCRHLANGAPFAVEDRLISLAAVPEAETIDFALQSPGHWLLGHVPWTQAENRISAINADAVTAAKLDIDVGAACLALHRSTWRGLEPITHVRQIFPGNRYDFIARLAHRVKRRS